MYPFIWMAIGVTAAMVLGEVGCRFRPRSMSWHHLRCEDAAVLYRERTRDLGASGDRPYDGPDHLPPGASRPDGESIEGG